VIPHDQDGRRITGGRFAVRTPGTHPVMTEREDGVWRDEEKTSVKDLSEAMATWDTDGQGDPTGNDAGLEQATPESAADQTDPDRAYRPGTTG